MTTTRSSLASAAPSACSRNSSGTVRSGCRSSAPSRSPPSGLRTSSRKTPRASSRAEATTEAEALRMAPRRRRARAPARGDDERGRPQTPQRSAERSAELRPVSCVRARLQACRLCRIAYKEGVWEGWAWGSFCESATQTLIRSSRFVERRTTRSTAPRSR